MLKNSFWSSALIALLGGSMIVCTAVRVQAQATERPFAGTANGAIVNQIPPNGIVIAASGQATHLGQFRRQETIYLNPNGSIEGHIVFYSADGDELRAAIHGQFTSATTVAGQYQFAGGTGRFANAVGNAEFRAVTPDGVRVTVQFQGRIRY